MAAPYSPYSRFQVSDVRGEPLPPAPSPQQPTRSPTRATPTPTYTTIHHPTVLAFLAHVSWVLQCGLHHYIPQRAHGSVFALAALAVFACPNDPAHAFFWGTARRSDTAAAVQRVLESGECLIIPVSWPGVPGALALLADREARAHAASLKRKARAGGAKGAEPPQKVQRVTRASVRQQQPPLTGDAPGPSDTNATPPSENRRRAPPPEAPTPQRTSARQQKRKEREEEEEGVPSAVAASVRPAHTRARSTSQDSNETIVASSSSSSRAASVTSADTVVDVLSVFVGGDKKGKGRAVCLDAWGDEDVVPIAAEGTRVTRSRTQKTPVLARSTPYPATKNKQAAAGRRVPTGKRKAGKSRV